MGDFMKLYWKYFMIHLKSKMEYKTSFLLTCIGQFLVSFQVFLGIYFMFRRFSSVEGFTYEEVLLCFGITLMEFSLAESVARGFDLFPVLVRKGEFDRIMVRPRNEILQVLGSRIEFTRIGRMLQAVVMFCYGVSQCGTAHASRRNRGILRSLSALCRRVLLYFGRTGNFQHIYGRRKGIREIPGQYLWQAGTVCLHVRDSLCVGTILPAPVFVGQGQRMVRSAAVCGAPVPASLFCGMEMRGQTLYFLRVIGGHYNFNNVKLFRENTGIFLRIVW